MRLTSKYSSNSVDLELKLLVFRRLPTGGPLFLTLRFFLTANSRDKGTTCIFTTRDRPRCELPTTLLKGNLQTKHIPVIALSSKSSAEEEAKLLDIGYFDFIAKPINPVRLVARVKHALRINYGNSPPPR